MTTKAGCFCEAIRPGVIRQPVNAWSSLSFVLVGFIVLQMSFQTRRERHLQRPCNLLMANPIYSLLYVIALLVIGLGSAFYHASLTFVGQTIDVIGMYFLATFMLLYAWSRLRPLKARHAWWAYLVLNALLTLVLIYAPYARRYIFALLILAVLALEMRYRKMARPRINSKYLVWGVGIMLLAFVLWVLDIKKLLYSPQSLLQGHALWHMLGAVSAMLLFLYYRSEAAASAPAAVVVE
jgi:hypothetical protein